MRSARGERGLWQRRFWEHAIGDDADYAEHVDYLYCHINPVKHGFVQRAVDWPYSTFHRYVEQGIYTLDWACGLTPRLPMRRNTRVRYCALRGLAVYFLLPGNDDQCADEVLTRDSCWVVTYSPSAWSLSCGFPAQWGEMAGVRGKMAKVQN